MVTNDGTIIKIKHDILCEVAKLVFAGKFEEERRTPLPDDARSESKIPLLRL